MTTLALTAYPDGEPAPYVDVLAEDFDPGVETVTVWRVVGGRSYRVRGLVRVSSGGIVTVRDFEVGLGVTSQYRVQQFDGAGEFVSWSDPEPVAMPDPEPFAWIHNPLDPSTSLRVRMLAPVGDELLRPVNVEVLRAQGRSLGVSFFGARSGLQKVVLDCLTETAADAARFDGLFGGYDDLDTVPILCIRAPRSTHLPATMFAAVADPVQAPFNFGEGGEDTVWRLTGDEVSPPPEAVVTSLLGYDDFTAFYSDYAEFTAAYADYREAQRDYSIAGTA